MGRSWEIAALGIAAVLGMTATTAHAGVVRAEGVLPPGQSGHVSLTGLLEGTGSPHQDDQRGLFTSFRRKSLLFGLPGPTERPRPGVTIVRDAHGVPQVTGATELDAWWGAGYAVAQDRLFQLEAFRHATTGRLAELTGKGALQDDLVARRDYYTPEERQAMLRAAPADSRARLEAYRDGINAWIAVVNGIGVLNLPAEYVATLTPVQPWTLDDSVAIGIFLGRTIPSGDGAELRNLRALQRSGSARVLQELLPLRIRRQLSTIPQEEGEFPQGDALTPRQEAAALRRSVAFVEDLPATPRAAVRASLRKDDPGAGRIGRTGGSSMFAIRKPGGGALLFNGPQLGFSAPELFVELAVHAPGLNLRGVTAPGLPVIGTGHNGRIAWGITSGLSDDDDLYAEKLVPGEPEKYWHKGEIRDMDCRDETFRHREGLTAVLDGRVPESGQVTRRVCRTVHGPVQHREGNVAYARRYAIWKRETETLYGLEALNRARDIHDVDRAVRRVTWNENVMAADGLGNIGYWHPGLLPRRPKGWDQRLPLPGTGEAEWDGLVDRDELPRVINPGQGWLANWNNVPSQGWTTGDGPAEERVTGAFHRNGWFTWLVRSLAEDPTFEGAERLVRQAGSVAQQRPLASYRLRRAAAGLPGAGDAGSSGSVGGAAGSSGGAGGAERRAATVLRVLLAWDGDYTRTDDRGTVDPGVATWEAFKAEAARIATAPLGPGADEFRDDASDVHQFDVTLREAYALRTLRTPGYRQAAAATFDVMAKRFGTDDPTAWREPRRMVDVEVQGAMQPDPLPFFDRGTWEHIVELEP
ncbi:MAG: penicillin acylase family protein [Solirubrobacteraceae bacterium]|nr:penicillin acylase family protein [Solirubrobacteraceae bacterium]